MLQILKNAIGAASGWLRYLVTRSPNWAVKLLKIHPFILTLNIYCALMSTFRLVVVVLRIVHNHMLFHVCMCLPLSIHSQTHSEKDQFHEASAAVGTPRRTGSAHVDECPPFLGQGVHVSLCMRLHTISLPCTMPLQSQFSDYERANFLNNTLKVLWPAIDAKLSVYVGQGVRVFCCTMLALPTRCFLHTTIVQHVGCSHMQQPCMWHPPTPPHTHAHTLERTSGHCATFWKSSWHIMHPLLSAVPNLTDFPLARPHV